MTKRIGTKGQNSQSKFDTLLSDLKDDELEFLRQRYNKYLYQYRKGNKINQDEYLKMQQRKKMIDEEIRNRKIFKTHTHSEIRFYPSEGTIVDSDNNILETIAYTWDESEIISVPSGNKGKKEKEEWEPKIDDKDDSYTMMSDVELPWKEWIKKNKLDEDQSYC